MNKLREVPQEQEQPPAHRRGGQDAEKEAKLQQFQTPPEQVDEDFFQMNDTSRVEYTNEYYKRICSEMVEDFLFLGSDLIAKDREMMKKHGITHIINCAADYSDNYFPDEIRYKSYHLKDHVRENIECIFYDAIEFIE